MITDEQVRIALAVWFQDEECAPNSRTQRDMRNVLEAVVGSAPRVDAGGWQTHSVTLEHPRHGTFWAYPGHGAGRIYIARCYRPAGASEPVSETIASNLDTLEAAQAAVARRIAELDAAQADTQPALEVAQ